MIGCAVTAGVLLIVNPVAYTVLSPALAIGVIEGWNTLAVNINAVNEKWDDDLRIPVIPAIHGVTM